MISKALSPVDFELAWKLWGGGDESTWVAKFKEKCKAILVDRVHLKDVSEDRTRVARYAREIAEELFGSKG